MKTILIITLSLIALSLAAQNQLAPKVTLEGSLLDLYVKNPNSLLYVRNTAGIQTDLDTHASKGYTLVSSSVFSKDPATSPGNVNNAYTDQIYLFYQKVEPPAETEVMYLVDKYVKEMEIRIRQQVVDNLNALPKSLDSNQDFLKSMYSQLKENLMSKYILLEKTDDIKTLADYNAKIKEAMIKEFDNRYSKKK